MRPLYTRIQPCHPPSILWLQAVLVGFVGALETIAGGLGVEGLGLPA